MGRAHAGQVTCELQGSLTALPGPFTLTKLKRGLGPSRWPGSSRHKVVPVLTLARDRLLLPSSEQAHAHNHLEPMPKRQSHQGRCLLHHGEPCGGSSGAPVPAMGSRTHLHWPLLPRRDRRPREPQTTPNPWGTVHLPLAQGHRTPAPTG